MNFYQDQIKWRHKLVPIVVSKNESYGVIDLLQYKNHYALNKKLNVFLGDYQKVFICRRCLISFTIENLLKLHKPKSENFDMTNIRTSPESHLHWKKFFHKNPLYFRIRQILKLIMRKIILVEVIKQPIFINKNRYLMVMK